MPESFAEIASAYANIISEAKGRLLIVEKTLSRREPKDALDYVAVSDLCALQFRKIFEAIALGCLAVHGDLPGTKRLRDDAYRADKLLNALSRLHPDFYPKPCEVLGGIREGQAGKIRNIKDGWLTKEELRRLYFKFDHEMHVGTLSRREATATAVQWSNLRDILKETSCLIRTHWIKMIDGSHVLCDTTAKDGPILIEVFTPV